MKTVSILLFVLVTNTLGYSQSLKSASSCDLNLEIIADNGTNALGICFDEKQQRYYTAFAGNAEYPLEAFTSTGEFLFTTELGMDARGFWFNTKKNTLEGIGYGNKDSYSIPVDALLGTTVTATITTKETNSYGMGEQQVGVSAGKRGIMFVENGKAYFFKKLGAKAKIITLNLASSGESLNQISPIYTGVSGKEIGLFNWETYSIEFYSAKDGSFSGAVELDYASCLEEIDSPYSFRVAYANNKVWLYDTYSRSWLGFSIWN